MGEALPRKTLGSKGSQPWTRVQGGKRSGNPVHFDGIHAHPDIVPTGFKDTTPPKKDQAVENRDVPYGMSEHMNVIVADQGRQGKLGLLRPGRIEALKKRLGNADYDDAEGEIKYPGKDTPAGEARE